MLGGDLHHGLLLLTHAILLAGYGHGGRGGATGRGPQLDGRHGCKGNKTAVGTALAHGRRIAF